jgi:AcrR family transcriptional regulator
VTSAVTSAAALFGGIEVGGLKGRAIDTALRMVEARGVEGFGLRDLAGELKTGQASLYYHFACKDELLAEVAAEGFRKLNAYFTGAIARPEGGTPLHACGNAYITFVREHLRLYKLMYTKRLLAESAVARDAEQGAFETFARGVAPPAHSEDALTDDALALWAFGRGLAALSVSHGDAAGLPSRDMSRRLVRGLESLLGRRIRQRADGGDSS